MKRPAIFFIILIILLCTWAIACSATQPVHAPTLTNLPTPLPTATPKPTMQPTPTEKPFWIFHRPSLLPIIECPDENPKDGILENSHPECRVTRSFWDGSGNYWGPIVKDDNGTNVDFNCIRPFRCQPSDEEMKVFSIDDGVIRNIDYLSDDIGWKVEVQYAQGFIGNFGHMADPNNFVKVGQKVKIGDQIGELSPKWDYFLAFNIFKKQEGRSVYYNPFDYGLTIYPEE